MVKMFVFILIHLFIFSPSVSGESSVKHIHVLAIHSYHHDYPWTDSQYQAFKSTLTAILPEYSINFSSEYLDTKEISPSKVYRSSFIKYIKSKYINHTPDLIYITDDNALNFIHSEIDTLNWKSPTVFSGINDILHHKSHSSQVLTGIFETKDIDSTLSLAKKIASQQKNIVFVGDGGTSDKAVTEFIYDKKHKDDGYKISFIHNNKLETLIDEINKENPDVMVLTSVGGVRDKNNRLSSLEKTIQTIINQNRKILVMEDSYLLPGVLGGYVTTARRQGASAAKIASRIIRGELPKDIEKQSTNTSELILSLVDLQRFNVNLNKDILNDAVVINQPKTFLEKYPETFKLTLFLVVFLLVVIGLFVFQVKQKNTLIKEQRVDKLTGLPNRNQLLINIEGKSNVSLAIIDVNKFNLINNMYGLNVGDKILTSITDKFLKNLDLNYELYRMNGDKFAIINSTNVEKNYFKLYIKSILHVISEYTYKINDIEIKLTLTSGVSQDTGTRLIPLAEQALKKAKKKRLALYVINNADENSDKYNKNVIWVNKLNKALKNDRIVPYFQLISDNRTGERSKVEALVRLIDEDGSVVLPKLFLDVAKSTRQYSILTKIMIAKTFDAIKDNNVIASINMTMDDIKTKHTVEYFKNKLAQYDVANKVIVELTESEGIDNYKDVSEFITEIKALGCRVAIDDFGTGYSNFTHLIHLNVDYLKIDGSIIKNIITDKNAEITAKTIVDFSKQLGIETIAEFVHSQEILDKVIELGIDYSQGYFLGKPEKEILI